ncbi:PhzF family phenazine biosynthesis protein [Sphingomonas sp. MMSM20]|uniref:PhzF family phenazine biosynthesis protein n=1 Tax=Sphingomonas lycopersici TaxID=2951807 RepID=UPI0022387BDC|nr:PhzF family phenazine biosynthesis protein [Sphingomonas lycopersici]MCW6530010.1 PhzF family phenazine biosynthesis protein [Sphingomonas lycopersici]
MPHRPFSLVDVFGSADFSGNPLAVIADTQGLTTEEMQRIAQWLNLSETTFLVPTTDAAADYHVRIFTLAHELPFAGHPTLGTCHAWLEAGGQPQRDGVIVQQCGAGLIELRRAADGNLAFRAPPLVRSGTPSEAEITEVAEVLRIDRAAIVDAQWVDNGPGWIAVMLGSAEAVLALEPARHHAQRIDIGVVGPHEPGDAVAFELRAIFSDAHGALIEDPVTGSLNASVGQWLFASGRARGSYVAAQGTRLGRAGRIAVSQDANGDVWVGGRTVTMFAGQR